MVTKKEVETQLKRLGIRVTSWGANEVKELHRILVPGEQIQCLVNGWYESGFATLVATNHRLLLVDKKILHLTIEDIRYDMIAGIDYGADIMFSRVRINTANKELLFKSFHQSRLHQLVALIQYQVMQGRLNQQAVARQFDERAENESLEAQRPWVPQTSNLTYDTPDNSAGDTAKPVGQIPSMLASQSPFIGMAQQQYLPKVRRRFHNI